MPNVRATHPWRGLRCFDDGRVWGRPVGACRLHAERAVWVSGDLYAPLRPALGRQARAWVEMKLALQGSQHPCCVCGTDTDKIACLVGPVSDFWCGECQEAPRLPYDYLAWRTACVLPPDLPTDFSWSPIIPLAPTLAFYEKTEEDFWALVGSYRLQVAAPRMPVDTAPRPPTSAMMLVEQLVFVAEGTPGLRGLLTEAARKIFDSEREAGRPVHDGCCVDDGTSECPFCAAVRPDL